MNLFVRRSAEDVFFERNSDGAYARTDAAVRVTHDSALTDDAILAAVSLLAGDIAGLPMRAFQTSGGLTQPLDRQPAWIEAPDPLDLAITDVQHRMQVALSLLLAGNAYVLCEPSVFDPVSLTVLDPTRVRVCKPGRERTFEVMSRSEQDGLWQPADVEMELSSAQVLHIPYLLRPGRLTGVSPIDAQSGNLGISIAMRRWVETFFGKGGQVSGLVSLPVGATGQDVDGVQSRIQSKWSSWRKAGVIGVLGGGATFIRTGLSPQDADLGALWRRQLEMAARIYGIPPFMIGSQEPAGVAYASSVERAQHYIDHCLARYTRPIEKAYSRLVPGDGRLAVPGSNTEVRFVFDAFLRGDPGARWATYLTGLQAKAMTIGEVRALENKPPMSGYSPEYLAGPDGLYQTPQNSAPSAETMTVLEQFKAGLVTDNEARAQMHMPPITWPEADLSPEEVASLIEQVKAGLLTETEARAMMKRGPIQWGDDLSPDEIASLLEQVKAGLLTHDEARALLKRPAMKWNDEPGPDEVASMVELVKAGLLTENEARAKMKLPPMQWAEGPSLDDITNLVAQVKEGLLTIDEARATLGRPAVDWPEDLNEKVTQAAGLIEVGFHPPDVLAKLGLPPIQHLGLPVRNLQKLADAAGVVPSPPGEAPPSLTDGIARNLADAADKDRLREKVVDIRERIARLRGEAA